MIKFKIYVSTEARKKVVIPEEGRPPVYEGDFSEQAVHRAGPLSSAVGPRLLVLCCCASGWDRRAAPTRRPQVPEGAGLGAGACEEETGKGRSRRSG